MIIRPSLSLVANIWLTLEGKMQLVTLSNANRVEGAPLWAFKGAYSAEPIYKEQSS